MSTPDKIKTIAAMREAGATEREIAEHFGVSRKMVWMWVRVWNAANPNVPVPRPQSRPKTPKYVLAAEMWNQRGMNARQIAKEMDATPSAAESWIKSARRAGLIPPNRTKRDAGGAKTYEHYLGKGVAPPRGTTIHLLAGLSARHVEQLLDAYRPEDENLAVTASRLLTEHFDAQTDPR